MICLKEPITESNHRKDVKMDKTIISNHLYNDSIPQAVNFINSINDEETLFLYAYNYNWDNGFDIPSAILKNKTCSLSIALTLFFASDGLLYLQDKDSADGTKTWIAFIGSLYKRILNGEYTPGKTGFTPNLTKVQEFKLRKILNDSEMLFITPIDGINCYTNL